MADRPTLLDSWLIIENSSSLSPQNEAQLSWVSVDVLCNEAEMPAEITMTNIELEPTPHNSQKLKQQQPLDLSDDWVSDIPSCEDTTPPLGPEVVQSNELLDNTPAVAVLNRAPSVTDDDIQGAETILPESDISLLPSLTRGRPGIPSKRRSTVRLKADPILLDDTGVKAAPESEQQKPEPESEQQKPEPSCNPEASIKVPMQGFKLPDANSSNSVKLTFKKRGAITADVFAKSEPTTDGVQQIDFRSVLKKRAL